MTYSISPTSKKILDIILSLAGLTVTELVQNAAQFSSPWGTIIGVAGAPVGYLISDLVAMVDTGALPSTATITQQAAVTWTDVKPLVVAQIAKITNPSEQATLNALIAVADAEAAKVA